MVQPIPSRTTLVSCDRPDSVIVVIPELVFTFEVAEPGVRRLRHDKVTVASSGYHYWLIGV